MIRMAASIYFEAAFYFPWVFHLVVDTMRITVRKFILASKASSKLYFLICCGLFNLHPIALLSIFQNLNKLEEIICFSVIDLLFCEGW